MKSIWHAMTLVLLATLVLALLGTAVFIGFGALLSQWLPLSLFHASSLAIGATLALALIIHALTTMIHFRFDHALDDVDADWKPDVDADGTPLFSEPDVPKVGRNAPCPCGSGKKYKNCYGKSPAP